MIRLLSLSAVLAMLLLLVACSSQQLLLPAKENLASNAGLWHWQAQGKLAVRTATESQSANLNWQQTGASYQIQLSGPLGQGSVQLVGQPFLVTLLLADGTQVQAASPEQLVAANLGWELPLSNLVYWIRGVAAPGEFISFANGQEGIEQAGWLVEWRRFSHIQGHDLPSLLVATNGQLEFRLALNNWVLHD